MDPLLSIVSRTATVAMRRKHGYTGPRCDKRVNLAVGWSVCCVRENKESRLIRKLSETLSLMTNKEGPPMHDCRGILRTPG